MELIRDEQDLRDNLEAFDRKLWDEPDASGFFHELVRRGRNFVSYQVESDWRFAPSRYVGYKDNSQDRHEESEDKDGGKTDRALSKVLGGDPLPDGKKFKFLDKFSQELGIKLYNNEHKFFPKSVSFSSGVDDIDPTQIPENALISEGAEKRIRVNVFERDPKLREQCVQHWGYKCIVCDFDFSAVYGEIGRGFIHVHHVVPLAKIRGAHQVDPVKDLIPVCPNCHAMLHRGRKPDRPRKVEKLKILMANARKTRQGS